MRNTAQVVHLNLSGALESPQRMACAGVDPFGPVRVRVRDSTFAAYKMVFEALALTAFVQVQFRSPAPKDPKRMLGANK